VGRGNRAEHVSGESFEVHTATVLNKLNRRVVCGVDFLTVTLSINIKYLLFILTVDSS
jgi:hypothetical protein